MTEEEKIRARFSAYAIINRDGFVSGVELYFRLYYHSLTVYRVAVGITNVGSESGRLFITD